MNSKGIKTTIIMVVMVALILGYYLYLSNRNSASTSAEAAQQQTSQEMTAVQSLIARADYKEYPATPVQVLKYYNEITSCFYNEVYSQDELNALARLASSLYDEELATNQSFEDYISALKDDIAVFKNGNMTIYDSQVTPATDVVYFSHNGYECAKLYCTYTLKSGTVYQASREVFILRKDTEGHWKILGFDLVEE